MHQSHVERKKGDVYNVMRGVGGEGGCYYRLKTIISRRCEQPNQGERNYLMNGGGYRRGTCE